MADIIDKIGEKIGDEAAALGDLEVSADVFAPVHEEIKNMDSGEFGLVAIAVIAFIAIGVFIAARQQRHAKQGGQPRSCSHRCDVHTSAGPAVQTACDSDGNVHRDHASH